MFVDVHAHLTHERFKNDQKKVIKRAKDKKVIIICAGSGHKDNQKVIKIAKQNDNVYASLGLYPWDGVQLSEGEIDFCIDYIRKNVDDVSLIGEIGLDHHWGKGKEDLSKQEWIFNKMLDLALEINKPILIHCRKAEYDVLEMIKTHKGKIIIHCYTGPLSLVPEFVKLGCYFSIPAVVVRSKSFKKLVRLVPINKILTETDSPFMSIEQGGRAEPVDVIKGLEKIAEIKGISIKQAGKQVYENFKLLLS